MTREIRADYGQQTLLPMRVVDYVGPDHPAHFVRVFVESLDLKKLGFETEPAVSGRPRYAPDLLLKVVLYGWMSKVRSLRALEIGCREWLPFLFLTGSNAPDHNTLWRFFKAHRKPLKELFKETVRIALDVGLVDMVTNALDGTKIQAACSTATGDHEGKLKRKAEKLDAAIAATFGEIEKQARKEGSIGHDQLPKELEDLKALRAKIEEARQKLAKEERSYRHEGEPDAELMTCRNAGYQFAYNAQVVVDAKAGIVVAQDVVRDQNDRQQLLPMLKKVAETVGRPASETLADSGYHTGKSIQETEQAGFDVLVNEAEQKEKLADGVDLRASRFHYDATADTCTCPTGRSLDFERTKINKQGVEVRLFRCHYGKECALATICTREARGRSIEIAPFRDAVARQRVKRQQSDKRELLKKRGQIVEWFHAQTKAIKKFTRFTMRGLGGASLQYALTCATHNLGIIMKHRRSQVQIT